MNTKAAKSFCNKAFTGISITPSGACAPCCLFERMITKPSGEVYKVWEDGIDTIYNSEYMRDVRERMLRGEKIEACAQCYQVEAHGGFSMRMQSNSEDYERPEHLDVTKPFTPKSYDLKLNNVCNLRCRMCQPRDSHLLHTEFSKIQASDPSFQNYSNTAMEDPDLKIPLDQIPNWPSTAHFREEFKKHVGHVKKIAFVGGEPLLIDETYELLDDCINSGVAGRMFIIFTSNFMHVPLKRLIERLGKFDKVLLNISLDAVGSELNYIRYPSNIETILKNIRTVQASLPKVHFQLSPTVQMYNVLYLDKVYLLAEELLRQGLELSPRALNLTYLEFPKHLNVRIAPQEVRQVAIPRLEQLFTSCPMLMRDPVIRSNLQQLIDVLRNDFLDVQSLVPEFLYYSEALDRSRDQDGKKVLPELFSLLGAYQAAAPGTPYYRLREQGWRYAEAGKFELAVEKFEQAVLSSPDKYLDYRELAWICLKLGRTQLSLDYARRAFGLNSSEKHVVRGLCFSLSANGLKQELQELLPRALELNPGDADLRGLQS